MKAVDISYHIFRIHFIFILQFLLSVASHSPSGTVATLQCESSVVLILLSQCSAAPSCFSCVKAFGFKFLS
uniref:Putative secreted protein n=1 Tax=Amblyomma cajennense TaxID=34607 RepID=A0A023FD02_AMBCJ